VFVCKRGEYLKGRLIVEKIKCSFDDIAGHDVYCAGTDLRIAEFHSNADLAT